jgi:hypothetical protein
MASKQVSIPDSRCCTEVATFEHTMSWTIKRFPLLMQSAKPKDSLESSKFEIEVVDCDGKPTTTVWSLRCSPAGDDENPNHVLLCIHLHSLGQLKAKKIRAEVELGLGNKKFAEKITHNFEPFDSKDFRVSHAEITSNPGVYTTENSLVVRCRITLGPFSYNSIPVLDPLLNKLPAVKASAASLEAWEALKEQQFVDLGPSTVTMVFGDGNDIEEELCHSFPLAARSPVLRKALTADMLERSTGRIEIPDMSAATGREMIFYCYTGHVRQNTAVTQELLVAANKYEMRELEEYCVQALASTVNNANWTELLLLSDLCMSSNLKKRVLEYVRQNRGDIVKQKFWRQALEGRPALLGEMMQAVIDS